MSNSEPTATPAAPSDFVRDIVAQHVAEGKYPRIHTRFPPEPNGYLHIGHAKSICLNFGIAREFGGICNLRMDDTNPTKEEVEYVDSIIEDVNWLIAGWADDKIGLKPKGKAPETLTSSGKPDFYLPAVTDHGSRVTDHEPFYASDYFEPIYEYAVALIKKGAASVVRVIAATPEQQGGEDDEKPAPQVSPSRKAALRSNKPSATAGATP
jgi:glutaminyl-tRNA synthetase